MRSPSAAVEEMASRIAGGRPIGSRRSGYSVLAWSLSAVSLALLIGTIVLIARSVVALAAGGPLLPAYEYVTNTTSPLDMIGDALNIAAMLAFALFGALIIARYPTHPVGWIFSALSLFGIGEEFATSYAILGLLVQPGRVPYSLGAAWATEWTWAVFFGLLNVFLPLLFPTGRLLSPRWRPVGWFAGAACVLLTLGFMLKSGPFGNRARLESFESPVKLFALDSPLASMSIVAFVCVLLSMLLAAVSLIVRLRRARGDERQQLKWFCYPTALLAGLFVFQGVVQHVIGMWSAALDVGYKLTWAMVFAALPIATGIAILKYRLYEIDLVINRTLVYGALTAVISGIYVLVVGALGTLFQARGHLLIALFGAGLVAVLFQPLRVRLQRGVNRLLYGERDDPYAVLSRLGRRLEATFAPNAVLPTIVETVKDALKLPYVAIALATTDHRPPTTDYRPPQALYGGHRGAAPPTAADEIAAAAGTPVDNLLRIPLVYQTEAVGALLLGLRAPGEPFSPADRRLLDDIANQAGVAVHAVRLTADLQRSRERLVAAREEERRRLRRDLHDGLGPALATQTLKLEAARDLIAGDPARAADLLSSLIVDSQAAIADIRRLVYALRPPALDDLGLVSAVSEQVAQCANEQLAITIDAPDRLPPLPAAVEVAAYRIVQEALTNVVKHARAHACTIQIALVGDGPHRTLALEVRDDGIGLPARPRQGVGLHSMRERAEELGGAFVMASGRGTRISAYLPAPQMQEE